MPNAVAATAAIKQECHEEKKTAAEAVLCGGLAGCASKTAMAPLERARILLQVGKDTSFVEALRRVWRTEGFQGLWAGNGRVDTEGLSS